jgi:hypothetical protein
MEIEKIIQALEEYGYEDFSVTLHRFVDDEGFYLSILSQLLVDSNFQLLKKAIQEKDLKASFEYAHLLKGIISNCGISPMEKPIVVMVEILRKGSLEHVENLDNQLEQKRLELISILKRFEVME